jgi:hypothetical protein
MEFSYLSSGNIDYGRPRYWTIGSALWNRIRVVHQTTTWDHLMVERRTAPPALDGDRYRAWMGGRRIFISSAIEAEMDPARITAATYLRSLGAEPVMWEGITPQDQRAEDAYLTGANTSNIFVLLLGTRYGRTDTSGYSPTHKESNRARELGIPRLVFEHAMKPEDRDGRLNDWLASLYAEVSAARYTTPDDMRSLLDARLRELAGGQDSHWVKLGTLVFPAAIRQRTEQGASTYRIQTRLRDPAVRRLIPQLSGRSVGGLQIGPRDLQLTWGVETHMVRVESVDVNSTSLSIDEVEITARVTGDPSQSSIAALGGMTYSGPGGTFGPGDQVLLWARQALFGEEPPSGGRREQLMGGLAAPEGPGLPEVLQSANAQGWLAEGLTRLYLIENLGAKFGGHFEKLEIGPATADGVRIRASYRLGGSGATATAIAGTVPLRR